MNCCFRHFFGPKIFPIAFKSFMSHAREKQTLTETHVCGLDCLNWFNFVHIFFCRTVHFFFGTQHPAGTRRIVCCANIGGFHFSIAVNTCPFFTSNEGKQIWIGHKCAQEPLRVFFLYLTGLQLHPACRRMRFQSIVNLCVHLDVHICSQNTRRDTDHVLSITWNPNHSLSSKRVKWIIEAKKKDAGDIFLSNILSRFLLPSSKLQG